MPKRELKKRQGRTFQHPVRLTSIYNDTRFNRNALVMTETELKLIAAAIIGDSKMPKNGYKTPAAIGTPKILYTKEKNRFWRMLRMVAWLK